MAGFGLDLGGPAAPAVARPDPRRGIVPPFAGPPGRWRPRLDRGAGPAVRVRVPRRVSRVEGRPTPSREGGLT